MSGCNPLHSNQKVADGIHIPYAFEFANASARGVAVVESDDVGKLARQDDDNSMWMLVDTTPTWISFGGDITTSSHRTLPQLIHYVESGPDGYGYRETLPPNAIFPTSITWWDSSLKTNKIIEKLITWSGPFPSSVVWNVYLSGIILETLTDSYDYSGGNKLTPKITRIYS